MFVKQEAQNLATFLRTVSGQKITECKISKSQRRNISPIWHFGDLSDEISGTQQSKIIAD
jgi:hypothetical protein